MNLPPIDVILAEEERRKLYLPNRFNGVSAVPICVNGRVIPVAPKLRDLYTINGISSEYDRTEGRKLFPIEGGRGGGKSEAVAQILVEIAEIESTTILCTREIQNSIGKSVYKYIKKWVKKSGYADHYHITRETIRNLKTGTEFIFMGMKSGTNTDSVKSLEGIKYVWCEEAQTLSHSSIKMLLPTIREEGCKIFFTFNPKTENDPVALRIKDKNKAMCFKINYYDNPFLPETLYDDAIEDKESDFEEYLHIWEGMPLKDDPAKIILPYAWLERCINLHEKIQYKVAGIVQAGADIAEGDTKKHDKNSLTVRQGPLVRLPKSWQCKQIYQSMDIIKNEYYDHGFQDVIYDAIGVGVAIGSEASRIDNVETVKLPFTMTPFKGSFGVYGGDSVYIRHGNHIVYNKDFFRNAKSQQWWNLRLRLENSIKLLDGKKIDRPDYFISFEGNIEEWRDIFTQMSQATYKRDNSQKIVIDKQPGMKEVIIDGKKEFERSPNDADSVGYAFAGDFLNGLRAHGEDIVKEKKPTYYEQSINTRAF